ncbi:hypothetical protein ABI59_09950 [Acidobacteria bacterium Mor1]|nr:hypothetical protein ABI59_09950 [Acidobacteria bacterium Mor1]
MHPTQRAIGTFAAGLAISLIPALGFTRAWPVVIVVWGAYLLVLGIDGVRCPRRRNLRWEVQRPEALYVGQFAAFGLELSTVSGPNVPMRMAVDLSDNLTPHRDVSGLATRETSILEYPLEPVRRGTATLETLWLRSTSPLGLWHRTFTETLDLEIPVLPNTPLVRSTALRFFADRTFRAGLKVERYRGDGTEFESLKDFLTGDDHRTIDWKQSARHRRLYCRHNRAERNHQIVMAIDTGVLMSERLAGLAKLDHAINGALTLAYVGLAGGDRVGIFSFGATLGPSVEPLRGMRSMMSLVHLCGSLSYSHEETNYTLGLTTLAQRLRRRSLIVLLTDFVDTVTAELMLENIRRMGRRHLVIFASLRDPLLGQVSRTHPGDVDHLNRAVVAGNLLQDREVVHRRLQRLGVHTLDVEPAGITANLINQYLDIKRRELV